MRSSLPLYLAFWAFWLMSSAGKAQLEFTFSDTVVRECKGILYDNGGDGINYLHNSNQTFTICLDAPGITTLSFESFCVEVGFDSLSFHLGPDETYPQIGPAYSGNTPPPPITFTHVEGCLSLHFVTDANVNCTGWEASWTTQVIPPVPPHIDAVLPAPACSTQGLTLNLSRKLHCDSVYAGAFRLLGPEILQGALDQAIVSATPLNCIGDSTQQVSLSFAPGLNQGGTYELELTTHYYDACDSLWTFTSIDSFRVDDCPIVVTLIPERDSLCVGECTEIEAIVTGGNGIYSYSWSGALPPTAGPQVVCPTATGTYTLTVDDTSPAVPASGSTLITVFTPAMVPAAFSQCQSAPAINLSATPAGGTWFGPGITDGSNGTFVGDSALAGVNAVGYYLPITPSFGCTSIVNINILPIDAGLPEAACPGSSPFFLSGFSPAGGTWSGPNISPQGQFNPATVGVYTLTYTVNGCSETREVYVDSIANVPQTVDSLCQSGATVQFSLSPPGGRWSGPGIVDSIAGRFDPGEAEDGLHTLVYSLSGCAQSFEVYVKPIFAGWNSNACPVQGQIQLEDFEPAGGLWSGDGIIDPVAGTVDAAFNNGNDFNTELIYAHPNGCTDTMRLYVEYTYIEPDTLVFCLGDTALWLNRDEFSFGPWGGNWLGTGVVEGDDEDSAYFFPALSGDGIHPLVYSNNTCNDTLWVAVQQQMLSALPAVCESSPDFNIQLPPYALPGIFGGDGIIEPASGLFSPQAAGGGFHTITYQSALGCLDTLELEINPFIEAEADGPGGLLCYIDTLYPIELSPAGGQLTGAGVVDSSYFNPFFADEGEHRLVYSIGEGYCLSTDTLTLTVAPRVDYTINVSDDSLCFGDYTAINLNAWGGNGNLIQYLWNEGLTPLPQQIVSPQQTTNYQVLITDGCSVLRDTVSIFVAEPIVFQVSTSATTCFGNPGWALVEANEAYLVEWEGGAFQVGDTLPALASSTNALEISNPQTACAVDTSIFIPGFPLVQSQFIVNPNLDCIPAEQRDINFIDLSSGAAQGTWFFGDSLSVPYEPGMNPTHNYALHGEYVVTLEVADSNGCSDRSEQRICLEEPFKLYLPNAFTVNNDLLNEVFMAKGTGIRQFSLWIYDRRGVNIFRSQDLSIGWDGTYKGEPVQSGVYGWLSEVQWTNGEWFNVSGTVTLIR
jgi:gliding motility-associated-like protein